MNKVIQEYYPTLYVPICLLEKCFKRRLRELQVYLAMKFYCNGRLELTSDLKYTLLEDVILVSSWKTINTALKKLVENNWIGFKPPNNYYPRSFNTVCQLENCNGNQFVECAPDFLYSFRPFSVAAIVSAEIKKHKNQLKNKNLKSRIEESANGGSCQSILKLRSDWMSANMLSSKLGISKSRAHELKQEAAKNGYISIKANRQELSLQTSEVGEFRKLYNGDFWIEPHPKTGKVYVRGPDIITSHIRLKYRKYMENNRT
ncbi:hypothetical protein [Ekhidna sp.]|uniref:hypothetical protein n=1 Tax=Ekhidna sp. TaxID=2608089 RepID=UPI003296B430